MKVVHVTTSSKGGAGIAAYRLHTALLKIGVSSAYVSLNKTEDFKGREVNDEILSYKRPTVINKILRKFNKVFNPSEADKIDAGFRAIKDQLHCEIATLPFSRIPLEDHPLIKQADIVHLHWVANILDYRRFFSEVDKPIVWTLHDMNPFMGLFHYKLDEQQNPIARDLNDKIKDIKKQAIRQIAKGAVVTPSRWLLQSAIESGSFQHFNIHRSIANGIDTALYSETDRTTARIVLDLNPSEKVLLFTAARLEVERKGMGLLKQALEKIDRELTILTMGKGTLEISNKKVKIIPLGYRSNPLEIANCYAAADVFLLPSLEDNLPNTMLESFAAGTAVISFSVGGMKEHIQTGSNGILVSEINSETLAKTITEICDEKYVFDTDRIKAYAQEHFNRESQANKYLNLYRDLLIIE
ncbi:MAG: glycosyltransferase [Flavobacteriaceae bacterium]|nr:glycosyltransferase [Flavobacteriaceae bacterium]